MLRCVAVYKFRLTSNKLCGFSLCQNDMSFNNFCITKKIAIPSGAFVVLTNINLEFTEIYNRIASLLEPQNLKCNKYQPFMANRIHLGGKTSELFCVHVITLQHFTQCPSTCKIGLWCWQPAVFDTAHPLCVAIVCYCRHVSVCVYACGSFWKMTVLNNFNIIFTFLVMCYFWQKHAYTTFALLYAGQWIPTVRNGLPFIVYRRYNWSNHILCHSWAYSSTRIQSVCSSSDKVFKQMFVFHMTSN